MLNTQEPFRVTPELMTILNRETKKLDERNKKTKENFVKEAIKLAREYHNDKGEEECIKENSK